MSGLRLSSPLLLDLIATLISQRGGRELLKEWHLQGKDAASVVSFSDWIRIPPLHEKCCLALVSDHRIESLFVHPDFRRQGHGASLLAYVLSAGAPHDGVALPGDRETKSLYEKAGFKARLLTMSDEDPSTDD